MTIDNAIKKLNKSEATLVQDEFNVKALLNGYVIEASKKKDGDIGTPAVRRFNDVSDPMTDYCAWAFFDNLTQAIKYTQN